MWSFHMMTGFASSVTTATPGRRGRSEGAWMDTHCKMLLVSKVVWMLQQLGGVHA